MQKENQMLSSREVGARDLPHPTPLSLLNNDKQPYFSREAEDPAQEPCGMTLNFMGFTLIELLVVVLIIGILAAVAVPQYQKTVWKSRAAQLYTDAKALYEAQQAYRMANGAYATKFDELAVEPSLNGSCAGKLVNYSNATDCRAGKYSMAFISDGTVFAIFHQGPYYHSGFRARGNTFYCYENELNKFCALMGYNTLYSQSGSNYYYSK